MKHWITTWLLVLIIQCGITAVVFWPEPLSQPTSQNTFAPFPIDAIDELYIGDEFDNEAVLIRSGKQWLLPELDNLPADSAKVDNVLRKLTTQSEQWPVASSSPARQRFQVADYYYQKRLTLRSNNNTLGRLFFGTSPGFRKLHARNEKQNEIYSINLNAFELPAINAGWLAPNLLQIRAPLRIDTGFYNIYFEDGRWQSATGGAPDEVELEVLIDGLKNLQVSGIANADLQRELSETEADQVLSIQSLAGSVTLELVTRDGEHYVHSSEFPLFFRCSANDCGALANVDARLVSGEAKTSGF